MATKLRKVYNIIRIKMKSGLKKAILVALLVTLVVPTTFFVKPKPVEAFGAGAFSCIFNALGLLGGLNSLFSGAAGFGTSVPVNVVNISTTERNTGKAASEMEKQNVVTCVLNALVWDFANTMIREFTASVVDWINRGFDGSPSFVTDPQGFFADVGDQVLGQWIEDLGPIGQILCSPFDLQIRLALGLGYLSRRRDVVRCRLSDVQKNIYNAFTGGQWGADGWSNWISISQPMNNSYGVYIYSSDNIATNIAKKMGYQKDELAWGGGFLSYKTCVASREDGTCVKHEISTPGAVIENQLNNALGSSQRRLEVADSVNEIMEALINQAVGQIFKLGGGGLRGMSESSTYYNGRSYVSSLMDGYQSQLESGQVLPPKGVVCDGTIYKVNTVNDVVEKAIAGRWERDSRGIIIEYRDTSYTQRTLGGYKKCVAMTPLDKNSGLERECYSYETDTTVKFPSVPDQTAAQFEDQIVKGCANLNSQAAANEAALKQLAEMGQEISAPGQTPGAGSVPAQPKKENLALSKEVTMSSRLTHQSYFTPDKAVDGQTQTCVATGGNEANSTFAFPAATRLTETEIKGGVKPFIQIDLGKQKNIEEINIFAPYNYNNSLGCADYIQNFDLKIYTENIASVRNQANLSANALYLKNITPFKSVYNPPIQARYIRLEGTNSGAGAYDLFIGEIEVWGTEIADAQSGGAPSSAPQSSARITSSDVPNRDVYPSPSATQGWVIENPITISSAEPIPQLNVEISLEKIDGTATTSENLNRVFKALSLERMIDPNQATPEIISPASGQTLQSKPFNFPVPSTTLKVFYLREKATFVETSSADTNSYGTYRLVTTIKESSSNLLVGKQVYTFTLKKPYQ